MGRKRNANIKRLSWVLVAVTTINLCLSGSVSAMEGWPQLVRQELTGGGSMGTEVTDGREEAETTGGQEEPETTGGQGETEAADNQEEPESTNHQEEPEFTDNQEEPETTDGQDELESADNQDEPESTEAEGATPSDAGERAGEETLSGASGRLERSEPDWVPEWYSMVGGTNGDYWTFVDRWGGRQYRSYGVYGDNPEGWMACDKYGEADGYYPIDVEEEEWQLAPYRYKSCTVDDAAWEELQESYGLDISRHQKEMPDSEMGRNYDGTNYDIWWLSENLEDWSVPARYFLYGYRANGDQETRWYECGDDGAVMEDAVSNGGNRAVHTIHTVLWHLGCPSLASSYKYQSVTAQCGDTINFVVHEYRYSSSKYDTPMDQGDSDLSITGRFIYNGRSGMNWVNLCGISGRAPGSASITVTAGSAGTWYAGHTYTDWTSEGSESGVRKSGQISIRVSGHNYDYKVTPVTEATCLSGGVNKKSCACGLSTEEAVPALGHDVPGEYDTTANDGTYFKDCSRCGECMETHANPYFIRFDKNLGQGTMEDAAMVYGTTKELPPAGFTRTGYRLKGWNTLADGTGTDYGLGETVGNLTPVYGATVALFARWEPIEYTAVFDPVEGTGGGSITAGYEEPLGQLPEAVRTGYRLLGWFTERNEGGGQVTASTPMPLDGATYFARWEICRYPIIWESHGGTEPAAWSRDYDTKLGNLPATERAGYTFEGWRTGTAPDAERITEETRVPLDGATYHARWKPIKYPITWESHGGTKAADWSRDYESKLGDLPVTKRAGYTFEGWHTGTESDAEQITSETRVALGGVTYHAWWKPIKYSITWESHGGTKAEGWSRDYDTKLGDLPATERTGYTFEGWHTGTESDAERITGETRVPLGGTTYHARWKPIKYPIIWESHGGTKAEGWSRGYESKLGDLPATKRDGYTFEGWHVGTESDAERITEETRVPLEGATYHARWRPIKYPITWESHGGTKAESWSRDYDTKLGELPATERTGYIFEGWRVGTESDAEPITEEARVSLGGATYHARWKPIKYPVAWESHGGTPVESWNRDYESKLGTLPVSERAGYSLEGWKTATASDAQHITEETTVPLNGAVYHADWAANVYPILWDSMDGVMDFLWNSPYDAELGELPVPIRYGYRFEGWYTSETFEEMVTETSRVPLAGATYYAKWSRLPSSGGGVPIKPKAIRLANEGTREEPDKTSWTATVHAMVTKREKNPTSAAIGNLEALIRGSKQVGKGEISYAMVEKTERNQDGRHEHGASAFNSVTNGTIRKKHEGGMELTIAGLALALAAAWIGVLWIRLLLGEKKQEQEETL